VLSLEYENSGMFDFGPDSTLIPATDTEQLSSRMSDHFPLLVEFKMSA
jgi:hypothetical protein